MSTQNRFLDEIAKMMTNAAGAARGVQQEIGTIARGQAERLLSQMDLVQRDQFEAVKAMAAKAREENAALSKRLAALEARVAQLTLAAADEPAPAPNRPVRRARSPRAAK